MLKKFIDRPILSSVISLIILMLGIVGMVELPITRFPEIAPPSVSVSASYSGADAETVASGVLLPLETQINGVEDMTYIRSKASTGSGSITIFFKQGTDPNQAAVNVQNRVSKANTNLPSEVIEDGVTVEPKQRGSIMTLNVYSDDPALDETFLQAYSNINIVRDLQRVDGVAEVSRIGARNYAVRIWLDPNKLRGYSLNPSDIRSAVQEQNFEIAPGEFGQNSDQAFQTVIKHEGRFTSIDEFNDIIVKTTDDGSILRLKDVARVELSATNLSAENTVDGKPGLTMNITQNSGANAREIDIGIREKMEELAENFPQGMKYNISYSVKDQVDDSISQVLQTLLEAFILVFIIVFIFLQDLRATLIPAIAIPVALIGTLFFIYLLGFSINILTMFALLLSIGIVVDDAIVIVEAIHEKMENHNAKPYDAAVETIKEISPAIVSITLVMAAVFIPVGFMSGPAGVFYQQFAYTLVIAILISAVNALTLTPTLSALFLKPMKKGKEIEETKAEKEQQKALGKRPTKREKVKSGVDHFFSGFNKAFDKITHRYIRTIVQLIKRKKLALLGLALISLIGFTAMTFTPSAFIPDEDNGFIIFSLKLPPGSSLARTNSVLKKAVSKFEDREEIFSMSSSAGYNAIDNATSSSYAMGYINMYPHNERKGIKNIDELIDTIRNDLSDIKEAEISVYTRPTVEGFGDENGVRFVIDDRIGEDYQALGAVSRDFLTNLNKRPEILQASTTFEPDFPQTELIIDREKAKMLGVGIHDLMDNIRQFYSRVKTSEFNLFNRLNFVYVQGEPKLTESPSSLNSIFVRSDAGEMVPVSTLIEMRQGYGPEVVTRHNLFNSVEVTALPNQGYSTGEVIKTIDKSAADELPGNYQRDWIGLTLEEEASGNQAAIVLALSLLFVYFLLTAQYESYLIPFSVLLSVPVGLIGIYSVINIVGLEDNIYVQVGLLMLIGLIAKNAILIVEYSMLRRQNGHSILNSAIEGARLRFRPILMTSLAFVAGMIPLMWSSGPSAQGNHSISFGAAGGMLAGVAFGLLIVPVLYVIFQAMDENLKNYFKKEK